MEGSLPSYLLTPAGIVRRLPWAPPFNVQAQLKIVWLIMVAAALVLLTAPFVGLAALFIWL